MTTAPGAEPSREAGIPPAVPLPGAGERLCSLVLRLCALGLLLAMASRRRGSATLPTLVLPQATVDGWTAGWFLVAILGGLAAMVRVAWALLRDFKFGLLELLASGVLLAVIVGVAARSWPCTRHPQAQVQLASLAVVVALPIAAGVAWERGMARRRVPCGLAVRLLLLLYAWGLAVAGAAVFPAGAAVASRYPGSLKSTPLWAATALLSLPWMLLAGRRIERRLLDPSARRYSPPPPALK